MMWIIPGFMVNGQRIFFTRRQSALISNRPGKGRVKRMLVRKVRATLR